VIGDLPRLTSGLSKNPEGKRPYDALEELKRTKWWNRLTLSPSKQELVGAMTRALADGLKTPRRGSRFVEVQRRPPVWYADDRLKGVCNHETRSHIREDLWRYFFCACYARSSGGKSPRLADFPEELLPAHKNVAEAIAGVKFGDRFRVQPAGRPSCTVTSHISKDGHYFIHYDPEQYRSLTVREAARLQTFPDNYFFEGPRTQQFHQVGNAVPPKLAYQIAEIVSGLFPAA
jgi:DNA (cytosine-5)-methyltransferase 1